MVIASMSAEMAEEPAQRLTIRPTETTSPRGGVEDGVDGVADEVVGDFGVEHSVQETADGSVHVGQRRRSEQRRDQSGEPEQGQQHRRGGQRTPKRRLRAQAEQ